MKVFVTHIDISESLGIEAEVITGVSQLISESGKLTILIGQGNLLGFGKASRLGMRPLIGEQELESLKSPNIICLWSDSWELIKDLKVIGRFISVARRFDAINRSTIKNIIRLSEFWGDNELREDFLDRLIISAEDIEDIEFYECLKYTNNDK